MSTNRNVTYAPFWFEYDIIITTNKRQNIHIHNGGTMTRKWGIIIATTMVVVTQLACGGGADDVKPVVEQSPARQKQMAMDNAYELDETLFMYDVEQSTKYALYYGNVHIVFLKPHVLRGVKLTTSECLNLSVRKQTDNDDWAFVYAVQNISPGDYVLFDGSWRVTRYNPANAIATGG